MTAADWAPFMVIGFSFVAVWVCLFVAVLTTIIGGELYHWVRRKCS